LASSDAFGDPSNHYIPEDEIALGILESRNCTAVLSRIADHWDQASAMQHRTNEVDLKLLECELYSGLMARGGNSCSSIRNVDHFTLMLLDKIDHKLHDCFRAWRVIGWVINLVHI
jgi:hypothetical protein